MNKPRILSIVALPPPHNGVAIANHILFDSAMVKNKYELKIVRLRKNVLNLGGAFSIITSIRDSIVILKTLINLLRDKPAAVYFTIAQTRLGIARDICLMLLSKLLGAMCVVHLHGGYFRNYYERHLNAIEKKLVRKAISLVDGVIVLDASLGWIFQGLVPPEKIFVLANGAPEVFTEAEIRQATARRQRSAKLRVTYLSNFMPGKGFDTFLEAAAILNQTGSRGDFLFNLAGAAPDEETAQQIKCLVRRHRLEDSVLVLGKVLDKTKWDLLLDSDIFVFPTAYLYEGQPLVIIEALAAGLPIISSQKGSIPSMVRDGKNGFIVPANEPCEVAQRLRLLKANSALRLSMGQASRDLYLSSYSGEQFVQGFCTIMDQVLGRGGNE
jgi:glycosyltransferase involved in cell wall biosynthesis